MYLRLIERPGLFLAPLSLLLGLVSPLSTSGRSGRGSIYIVLLIAYCVFRVGQRGTCLLRARSAGRHLPYNDLVDWLIGMMGAFAAAVLFYGTAIRSCGDTSLGFVMTHSRFWLACCLVAVTDTWLAPFFDRPGEPDSSSATHDTASPERVEMQSRPEKNPLSSGHATDSQTRESSAHAAAGDSDGSDQNCVVCQHPADTAGECRECGGRFHPACKPHRSCPVCGSFLRRESAFPIARRRSSPMMPRSGTGHTAAIQRMA